MHWLWKDLLYGLRGLRRESGFAAVAIVTLALGIGSATTIFSAIQNILLDPFPYADAKSVVAVQIHDTSNARPGGRTYYQTAEFLDLKEQSHVFSDVIGGTATGNDTPDAAGAIVSDGDMGMVKIGGSVVGYGGPATPANPGGNSRCLRERACFRLLVAPPQ